MIKKMTENEQRACELLPDGWYFLGRGGEFEVYECDGPQAQMFDSLHDDWQFYTGSPGCLPSEPFEGDEGEHDNIFFAVPDDHPLAILHKRKLASPGATESTSLLPDSGERSEFSTGAVRDAMEGKGLPSLLPIDALMAASKRFEDGAKKYGRNNWQKGIPLSRYVDAIYRHMWAFMQGKDDEDHGAAVIWNAMCLYQTKICIDEGLLPEELNDL